MAAGTNMTFTDYGSPVPAVWLNGVNSFVNSVVSSISALAALDQNYPFSTIAFVSGYYTANDGGGGIYIYNATMSQTLANGGTIIASTNGTGCWVLQFTNGVSVKQFGCKLDGVTNDYQSLNAAILASIAGNFKLTAPAGTCFVGTSTVAFPNTMPQGYTIDFHPDFIIQYSGTGSAVTVDSCYNAKLTFGQIVCTGGTSCATAALHIAPTNVGANGQNACVVSTINFQMVSGAQNALYLDNHNGSIAQCDINGVSIINGYLQPAGSMTGNIVAILVDGVSPNIFQGNIVNVNYPQPAPAAFAAGNSNWVGIQDGSTTFGPSLNNVNQYIYGAIDGAGCTTSYGLNLFAGYNSFTGPIVDVQTGVQVEINSVQNLIITADINILAGGTFVRDLTNHTYGAYTIVGVPTVGRAYGTSTVLSVAAGGSANYTVTFPYPIVGGMVNKVGATVFNPSVLGLVVSISTLSTTGMIVTVFNPTVSAATCQVSWFAGD
jgi:hypothetical protein